MSVYRPYVLVQCIIIVCLISLSKNERRQSGLSTLLHLEEVQIHTYCTVRES